MFNSQPQFTIKAEKNKAFDQSCHIGTFNIKSGNIADCLEHCLENCRCQSFQICNKTKCQLCSSHKKENSSLLHEEDGCIYATYEMRHLTGHLQKLDDHCSGMSCSMKYNCCQQSDLCPNNKICKPINSQEQPWKRFTCECPEGYHGANCDEPITSCQGYTKGSQESGMYKVVDSVGGPLYSVYCHFDSDGAWTLVQSYSFANRFLDQFKKSLANNLPISENALTWSGYRLRKPRMKSIKNNSSFLQFTCDYEKHFVIEKSDFVQIPLGKIEKSYGSENVDVLENIDVTSMIRNANGRGKIGEYNLSDCEINLSQTSNWPLHVHTFNCLSCSGTTHDYFGNYNPHSACVKAVHRCVQDEKSTTQLWFGMRKNNTAQPAPRDATETSGGSVEATADHSHTYY